MLVLIAALLAGCSDDDEANPEPTTQSAPDPSTATSAEQSETSTTAAEEGDCGNRPVGSSAAVFDSEAGTYAAQGVALDPDAPALTYNVVQMLSGEDARRAWREDNPQDPDGPPNDYYIVDESAAVRTTAVREDATVFLTHLFTDGTPAVEADTVAGLDAYMRNGHAPPEALYWLTFESDVITAICEGYRP